MVRDVDIIRTSSIIFYFHISIQFQCEQFMLSTLFEYCPFLIMSYRLNLIECVRYIPPQPFNEQIYWSWRKIDHRQNNDMSITVKLDSVTNGQFACNLWSCRINSTHNIDYGKSLIYGTVSIVIVVRVVVVLDIVYRFIEESKSNMIILLSRLIKLFRFLYEEACTMAEQCGRPFVLRSSYSFNP